MSISSVQLVDTTGQLKQGFRRSYTETYIVITDDVDDNASTVFLASALPSLGDPFQPGNSFDFGAFCDGITPRRRQGNRKVWDVTVTYSQMDQREGREQQYDNPVDEPPLIDFSTQFVEEAMEHDFSPNKVPIENSAEDPYLPGLMKRRIVRVVTIIRSEAPYDDATKREFIDKVNDKEFAGKPAHTWLMQDITAVRHLRGNFEYARVTYRLAYNGKVDEGGNVIGWTANLLDAGFNFLDAGAKKKIVTADAPPQPVNVPQKLDGAGGVLAIGGVPVYNQFQAHEEADFDALDLGGLLD